VRGRLLGFLVLLFTVTAACNRGETSVLAEGPRVPDAEGVATDISFEQVVIDSNETYKILRTVESFATHSHDITPLLSWKDKYVHLGLDDDNGVLWIAGIGLVPKKDDPRVIYSGVFQELVGGRAVFKDGTTLRLASGVKAPKKGVRAEALIDPKTDRATSLKSQ
jgi:hypothetical protein